MYKGQPVPSTTYQQARAKVSDGKSVRVSVPANSGAITAGAFCYFDGFLGVAMADLANDTANAQDLVLQIELAEYETDQIDATQDFAVGTKIYWDSTAKKFTETPTAVLAGVVTLAKDAGDVIWFRVAPGIINDEAATAIGTMTALTTTEKSTLVEAINEVDAHADAANAAIGTLAELTTTEKGTAVGAINEVDTAAAAAQADATTALGRVAANVACAEDAAAEAVRTALRALLAALQAAGLMAAE